MNIGWIGLGKLGLPCALSLAKAGHTVTGYDTNPQIETYLRERKIPYQEALVETYMNEGATIRWADDLYEIAAESDVVFIAVQTPHDPRFEGNAPIVDPPQDFEYQYLVTAYRNLVNAWLDTTQDPLPVVIISTVLPGTFDRLIRPITPHGIHPIYNPFFIAMGTTIPDFEDPEFVLIGADEPFRAEETLHRVYAPLPNDPPFHTTSIPTAELLKVAYNTYIGQKIIFANTMMEICHKTGADCDDLIDGLSLATRRLLSPKYLRGGMGDGGGCHPRDNIALSWLADRLDLSYDLFGQMMEARENQTAWLASLAQDWSDRLHLPIILMGQAFKEGTNLTVGSPADLLTHYLPADGYPNGTYTIYDPIVYPDQETPREKAVYLITTRHPHHPTFPYPPGSVIIDPWGYIPDQPNSIVIRVGRK